MHKDAIKPGQKVVIIDDLIATGGTNEAMVKMIESLGGKVVKAVFLMELAGLKGRERLEGYDVDAVITYPEKIKERNQGKEALICLIRQPMNHWTTGSHQALTEDHTKRACSCRRACGKNRED